MNNKLYTYGGVGYCPSDPCADMHGLLRVVVRARNKHAAIQSLKKAGVKQCAFIRQTLSATEREIADCPLEGTLWVCEMVNAYLPAVPRGARVEANYNYRGKF